MIRKNFEKDDSYFFRFIGIMLVVAAHYSNYMYEISGSKIWDLLNKLGRYGVALFFLVSGYGLTRSACVEGGGVDHCFILRRIRNVYLPFVIMQLLALIYLGVSGSQMNAKDWIFYFIGMDYWYILVIMCLYCCFYIAVKYFKKYNEFILFLLVSLLNTVLALMGCEEWWYLTNYVFDLGVFLALHKGDDIERKVNKELLVIISIIGFIVFSVFYAKIDEVLLHSVFKIMAALCFAGFMWFFYELIPFHICLKPLNYIGKSSLYIYVLHVQILNFMRKYNIRSWKVLVFSIPAVIMTAMLYEWILAKLIK